MAEENVTATSSQPQVLARVVETPLLDPTEADFAARLAGAQLVPLHAETCAIMSNYPGGTEVWTACTCGWEAPAR